MLMDVSKLGLIGLIFVDAGVKINGTYYREALLTQKLLLARREICAVFLMQCFCCCSPSVRDNQPPGTTDTSPGFISPHLWHQQHRSEPAWLQQMGGMQVYQVHDVDVLKQRLIRGGFRHVQHVRPNRGPHKKGAHKSTRIFFSFFATW